MWPTSWPGNVRGNFEKTTAMTVDGHQALAFSLGLRSRPHWAVSCPAPEKHAGIRLLSCLFLWVSVLISPPVQRARRNLLLRLVLGTSSRLVRDPRGLC